MTDWPARPTPAVDDLRPRGGNIDFLMTQGLWRVDELRDQSPQRRLWVPREGRTVGEDGGRAEQQASRSGMSPPAVQ